MSKIQDLVPQLELCKKIPAGHFADSALVWSRRTSRFAPHEWVIPRGYAAEVSDIAPAPTLAEILAELPKYNENEVSLACVPAFNSDGEIRIFGKAWSVGYTHKDNVTDQSAATAALKLWLEMEEK